MKEKLRKFRLKINLDKNYIFIRKSLKAKLIFSYIVVALISILLIASLTYVNNKNVLTNKVTELSEKTSAQTKLSVDGYLSEIQNITSLVFAQNDILGYDPNSKRANKYEQEAKISEYLESLSLIKNFGDFALIYEDGTTIGKTYGLNSNGKNMQTIFKEFSESLNKTQDKAKWFSGNNEKYDKLYYVRFINDNLILVSSISVNELDTKFEGLNDGNMAILLVDNKDKIIYSTDKDKIGMELDNEINNNTKDVEMKTFETKNELITLNTCNNTWRLLTILPKNYILSEVQTSRILTIIMTIVCIIISAIFGLFFAKKISNPINKLAAKMKQAEEGDLTATTEVVGEDEIAMLSKSFNNMIGSIRNIIEETQSVSSIIVNESEELKEMSKQTSETSEGITKAMESIAEGTTDETTKLEVTMTTMDELSQSIGEIMTNIFKVSSISNETQEVGDKSLDIVKELDVKTKNTNEIVDVITSNIEVLTNSIKEIEQVIELIKGVSEQTNLLSLNASIEAARAGESGKGFAVVAEEVKKLAEKSRESIKSIDKVIKNVYTKANHTKQLINDSKDAFKEQTEAVTFTNDSFKIIISSTEKVTDGMENIKNLINNINSQKTEILQAANSIKDIMANSSANTEEVLAATQEQAVGAENLEESSRRLSEVVKKLEDNLGVFTTK